MEYYSLSHGEMSIQIASRILFGLSRLAFCFYTFLLSPEQGDGNRKVAKWVDI